VEAYAVQHDEVFESLGLLPSQAIVMFYKQVELHQGLPFDVKIPDRKLENAALYSDERMDAELDRGYSSYKAGKARPLSHAHSAFRRRHNTVAS